jgi:hypothetical protein
VYGVRLYIHRNEPGKAYEALGYQVDYPLMWKPWKLRPYQDVIREEWGIEPPRLYAMGFPHNNCGGRCIKQGVREWLRLRYHFPERFEAMKQLELAEPSKGGSEGDACHLLGGTQFGSALPLCVGRKGGVFGQISHQCSSLLVLKMGTQVCKS